MLWNSTTVTDKWHTEVQLQIFKLYSLLQPRQTEIWDLKQHFPPWEVLIHLPPCSSKNDIKCSSMTLHQCRVWRTEVMFNPTAPLGGSTEVLPRRSRNHHGTNMCNVLVVFIVSYRKIKRFAVGPWELSLYEYLKAKPFHSATAVEIETIERFKCITAS